MAGGPALMSAVDIGILAIVGLFAVGGMRRGFLLGIVDLVAFGLSLIVAARLGGSVADPMIDWGLPAELAAGAGFVVAAVISLSVIGLAARVLLAPLGTLDANSPLGWVNGVLGLLPGAVRGLAIAALVVLVVSVLPPELGLRERLAESRLATPIAETGRKALDAGLVWAGVDTRSLGIPYQLPAAGSVELPFADNTAVELETDQVAEQMLLGLLNQERADAGLSPLQLDPALAEVSRAHNHEMFALGYFGHVSPTAGSAVDRLAAAGLIYPLSGENIALAPGPESAHERLMNSPAYRANILNPGFTRVGIAALRSADRALMVTQEFAGP
jgi:uncharacterized protein YkwD/uncharacterized membrane protein required for colicin V production